MRRWVVGCAWLLVGACGGAPRASDTPGTLAPETSAEQTAELGGPTKGEFPAGTIVWIRIRSPARDLPALARLDFAEPEVKTVLENPLFVLSTLLGEPVARAVDPGEPVDVLYGTSEETMTMAFRPSKDAANAELARKELANGRWLLEPKGNSGAKLQRCELWRASSVERIVCGADAQTVVASAPFFFGKAAGVPSDSSFRMELSGREFWSVMLERMRRDVENWSDDPEERAGAELANGWIRDFVGGNRSLVLELDVEKSAVELGLELTFTGTGTASNLAAWFGPERVRTIPEAFWKLPKDSELVLAFGGVEHGTGTKAARTLLHEFFDKVCAELEVSESEQRDLEVASFGALPDDGRFVFAVGHDLERARELRERLESLEEKAKKPVASELERFDETLAGFVLIGVETESSAYLDSLRHAVELFEKPAASKKKPGAPGGSGGSGERIDPTTSHLKIVAKPLRDLPKSSLHIVDEVRPNPDYQPPPDDSRPVPLPHDMHVVAVADGPRVWLSMALDEKVAVSLSRAQLQRSRAGGGDSYAELKRLGGNRAVASGAWSVGGLVALDFDGSSPATRSESGILLTRLSLLPNRGRTPVPTWVEVARVGKGEAWSIKLQSRVPFPAVADVVAWFRSSESIIGQRQ
jgi:hypothetical protein